MRGIESWRPSAIALEADRRPSIGVAAIIVGIDPRRNGENISHPLLWTIREKKSKKETEKIAGQISFPAETRKQGEGLVKNTVGALVEFTNNPFVVENNLFVIPGQSHIQGKFSIRNNPIDVMVLIHEGIMNDQMPVVNEEVSPNGWMNIEQLLRLKPSEVRKFARDILEAESSERKIRNVISEYHKYPTRRIKFGSLLPEGFSSMNEFNQQREKLTDVVGPKSLTQ